MSASDVQAEGQPAGAGPNQQIAEANAGGGRPERPRVGWVRRSMGSLLLAASAAGAVAVAVLYTWWPAIAAVVTYVPVWIWLVPGLMLAMAGGLLLRQRRAAWLCLVWLLLVAWTADETTSVARGLATVFAGPAVSEADLGDDVIRVISLNTYVSTLEAVEDALKLEPDILLLQEGNNPWRIDATIARHWGDAYGAVWSRDPLIFVRGRVIETTPFSRQEDRRWVTGEFELTGGVRVSVVSLRLSSVERRLDLWTPECWLDHAEGARQRAREFDAIRGEIDSIERGMPLIVGGDVNTPGNHRMFRLLAPRLRDVLEQAGAGWPHTYPRDWPLVRIDRIWASEHFEPIRVRVERTPHSDHRMVVADLKVRTEATEARNPAPQSSRRTY